MMIIWIYLRYTAEINCTLDIILIFDLFMYKMFMFFISTSISYSTSFNDHEKLLYSCGLRSVRLFLILLRISVCN